MHYAQHSLSTPLGTMIAVATEQGLYALMFEESFPDFSTKIPTSYQLSRTTLPVLKQTADWLDHYFTSPHLSKRLPKFHLAGTSFSIRAWRALARIPLGSTLSYQALAKKIDSPKAARAIGQIMNRNPISILLPCHRIIGANGRLTGYGGGLNRKEWLLKHEGFLI